MCVCKITGQQGTQKDLKDYQGRQSSSLDFFQRPPESLFFPEENRDRTSQEAPSTDQDFGFLDSAESSLAVRDLPNPSGIAPTPPPYTASTTHSHPPGLGFELTLSCLRKWYLYQKQ